MILILTLINKIYTNKAGHEPVYFFEVLDIQPMKHIISAIITCSFLYSAQSYSETLTVYSSRNEELIKPIFEAFTEKTGVKINFYSGKAGMLLQKIKSEGSASKADVLLTVDAGNLWHAKKEGVLSSIKSPILDKNIPAQFRDDQGYWYGLSLRARTIVYNPNGVKRW